MPQYRALATFWNMHDYAAHDSLLRIVYAKRDQLSERQRLSMLSALAMYDGDWDTATQYACQLFEGEPVGACAFFASRTNRPQRVLEVWEGAARREEVQPLELDDGSFTLLFAADAYHVLGEYGRELTVAQRYRDRAPTGELRVSAEYAELRARVGLGQLENVRRDVEELATMGVEDVDAVARMRGLGLELRYHGHPEDGTWALSRAAELFERGLVEDARSVDARFAYCTILYHLEDWDAAWRELRALEAQDGAEETADTTEIEIAGYLGLTAARLGDAESVAHYQAWLRERDRNSKYLFGLAKGYLARIAAVLGRREEAVGTLRQAFKEGMAQWPLWGPELHWRFDFEGIADYEPYQELIRPKG
jgi:hypothetical protein